MAKAITTEELKVFAVNAKVEISDKDLSGFNLDETDRFVNFCRRRISKSIQTPVKVTRKFGMLMEIDGNNAVEVM
jgi:hypothetical protein